jgi:hypothetical protein
VPNRPPATGQHCLPIIFCQHLGQPYGFNIESVSIHKAEIEATTNLATTIAKLLAPTR